MHRIFKRVVVLINDINKIDDLIQKGVKFSTEHQKTLEVLFVQEKRTHSIFDYFTSSSSVTSVPFDKESIRVKIQKNLDALDSGTKSSLLIVEEDTLGRVLAHAKDCKDILFITNYDKELSQRLLEKTPYSYWIFKNSSVTHKNILLPIELSDGAKDDIQLTQDIFPQSAIGLVHDYRYMIPSSEKDGSMAIVPVVGHIDRALHQEVKNQQRTIFENYKKEFNIEGDFIEEKKGLNKDLLNYIKNRETDLVVMHHQKALMFVPSVTFNLLHEVPNDFLVLNR